MAKTLIYDGDCSLCLWISEYFGRLGIADAAHRRPYQFFEAELAAEMDAAGIHNEMLVRESDSGELRAGTEGFLWLLRDSYPGLARLLGLPPVRWLLTLGYRTVAYNRRQLAPLLPGVVCSCDPDVHRGFRVLFWWLVLMLHLLTAISFGCAAANALGTHEVAAVGLYLLAWPAAVLLARVVSALPARRLWAQVSLALLMGSLRALPILWLSALTSGLLARAFLGVALLVGLVFFVRSAFHRVVVRA